jgi:hypothetical protein
MKIESPAGCDSASQKISESGKQLTNSYFIKAAIL